ncbi:hypothetical protein D3C80_1101800 [compost metagenome]
MTSKYEASVNTTDVVKQLGTLADVISQNATNLPMALVLVNEFDLTPKKSF